MTDDTFTYTAKTYVIKAFSHLKVISLSTEDNFLKFSFRILECYSCF